MAGCSNGDVVSPGPCDNYRYAKPQILVFEKMIDTETLLIDTVTSHPHNIIRLASTEKASKYQWNLSIDTRTWTDSVLSLRYSRVSGPVLVRLVTFTERDTICSERDGWDTVYKTIYVVDRQYPDVPPIHGVYRGTSTDNPSLVYDITIGYVGTGELPYTIRIGNLPRGCSYPSNPEKYNVTFYAVGWRTIVYQYMPSEQLWEDNCKNVRATGVLSNSGDTISINFSYVEPRPDDPYPPESERKFYTFVGVRQKD